MLSILLSSWTSRKGWRHPAQLSINQIARKQIWMACHVINCAFNQFKSTVKHKRRFRMNNLFEIVVSSILLTCSKTVSWISSWQTFFYWFNFIFPAQLLSRYDENLRNVVASQWQSYSMFTNVMCSSVSLLHWLHLRTGRCVLCLKASNSCNQSLTNAMKKKFSLGLHSCLLMQQGFP